MEILKKVFTAPHIGATSLGIVMGALVWYFVARFSTFNAKALGSTVSVMVGGAVAGFFHRATPGQDAVWYYPIGLLISTIVFFIFWLAGPEGEKFEKFDA